MALSTFHVTAFENADLLWRESEGAPHLTRVAEFDVEAASPEDACEVAWCIGNREVGPATGWPRNRRSMSVGDFVEIDGHGFVCRPVGWDHLGTPVDPAWVTA